MSERSELSRQAEKTIQPETHNKLAEFLVTGNQQHETITQMLAESATLEQTAGQEPLPEQIVIESIKKLDDRSLTSRAQLAYKLSTQEGITSLTNNEMKILQQILENGFIRGNLFLERQWKKIQTDNNDKKQEAIRRIIQTPAFRQALVERLRKIDLELVHEASKEHTLNQEIQQIDQEIEEKQQEKQQKQQEISRQQEPQNIYKALNQSTQLLSTLKITNVELITDEGDNITGIKFEIGGQEHTFQGEEGINDLINLLNSRRQTANTDNARQKYDTLINIAKGESPAIAHLQQEVEQLENNIAELSNRKSELKDQIREVKGKIDELRRKITTAIPDAADAMLAEHIEKLVELERERILEELEEKKQDQISQAVAETVENKKNLKETINHLASGNISEIDRVIQKSIPHFSKLPLEKRQEIRKEFTRRVLLNALSKRKFFKMFRYLSREQLRNIIINTTGVNDMREIIKENKEINKLLREAGYDITLPEVVGNLLTNKWTHIFILLVILGILGIKIVPFGKFF